MKLNKIYWNVNNLIKHRTTDFFRYISIETHTVCNRRCDFCPNSKHEKSLPKNAKRMSLHLFNKIVNELKQLNYNSKIALDTYNEPLLDERLPHLITTITNELPSAKVTIFTNGDFLTSEKTKELIKAGVFRINIGIYDSKTKQKAQILKSEFNNIIKLSPINEKRVLYNRGGTIEIKGRKAIKPEKCMSATTSPIINYNGGVIICCNDYLETVKFGNVRNEKLIDIWNKESYRKTRENLRKGIFTHDVCKKCRLYI